MNITNPTSFKLLYSPTGEYTKPKFAKYRFVEVTDKEILKQSKITSKINSLIPQLPKTQNGQTCVKILKQLFASGSVIIGEYLKCSDFIFYFNNIIY